MKIRNLKKICKLLFFKNYITKWFGALRYYTYYSAQKKKVFLNRNQLTKVRVFKCLKAKWKRRQTLIKY